jgi:transposase
MAKLSQEDCKKIEDAFKQTGTIRGTKRLTGNSRRAVRNHLQSLGQQRPNAPAVKQRKSKLDPYKAKIDYLVKEKHLSAVRVLEEIRQLGYTGGYSILKDYIRPIRPKNKKRPRPPIDHPPGYEGQMDWSPHNVVISGRYQVVHTGSIVLCYSRWLYFHHMTDETLPNVIRLHEGAFSELGAVPERMTYDNMTTVGRHIGPGQVWINPQFESFADQWGFDIVILPPGSKERHGAVERPFHYIENNFLAGREFHDLADLNDQADQWRWHKANVRIHGTLRQRPVDRLIMEKPYLKPLSANIRDTAYKQVDRKIHLDFCVAIDTNRYSASPNLVGKTAGVRLYNEHLEIWVDGKFDCKHVYEKQRHKRIVLPEHEQMYKKMTGQKALLEEAFLRLGPPAPAFYEGLQKTRKAAAGYHLQRILQYTDRHGADVVSGAMAYAAKYGAFSAEAVFRIISGKKLSLKNANERVPENVRQWLRSYAVETQNPEHYDALVDQREENEDETDSD